MAGEVAQWLSAPGFNHWYKTNKNNNNNNKTAVKEFVDSYISERKKNFVCI